MSCIGLVHGMELDVHVTYSRGSSTQILLTNWSDSSQTTRAQWSEREREREIENHQTQILETGTKHFQIILRLDWIESHITVNFLKNLILPLVLDVYLMGQGYSTF